MTKINYIIIAQPDCEKEFNWRYIFSWYLVGERIMLASNLKKLDVFFCFN